MSEERLQKILAQAGLGSRRSCEEIILAGRVTVDGRVVTELGVKADAASSDIRVDGEPLAGQRLRYIILHKPAGYLSGRDPRAGYPSGLDLVSVSERLYAVGRLDQDSEGLLLLTNDGELTQRLLHPRYEHPKTYLVQVQGAPNPRKVRRWQHGVMLDDGPTAPAEVELLRRGGEGAWPGRGFAEERKRDAKAPAPAGPQPRTSWLKITLREGRKRQLRRMTALLGHPALRVIRIGLGPLVLGNLAPGKWRDLTSAEVQALRDLVAQPEEGRRPDERQRRPAPGLPAAGQRAGAQSTGERTTKTPGPSTIAIDGPSASGKSTVGGWLAQDLGYLYFDTGVMYRAITWIALERGVSIANEAAVTALAEQVKLDILPPVSADGRRPHPDGRDVTVMADGQDITWQIRRPEVERAVSPVSAYPGVRAALTLQQRRIGQAGRVVMVGRDIGTVVLPRADLKIYLDASLRERARRRCLERRARGENAESEEVLAEMKRRDEIDSNRECAPLSAAADAIIVDTSELTVEQVVTRVRGLIERWAGKVR
jgi:cytidylate kinase